MVHPKGFLETIYLGDRACKTLIIDGFGDRVILVVDDISRIRNASGNWEFYTEEDITDGRIVFTDVDSLEFDPPGLIPNDLINSLNVESVILEGEDLNTAGLYLFKANITSVGPEGYRGQVLILIAARGVHLEDPQRPGIEITE